MTAAALLSLAPLHALHARQEQADVVAAIHTAVRTAIDAAVSREERVLAEGEVVLDLSAVMVPEGVVGADMAGGVVEALGSRYRQGRLAETVRCGPNRPADCGLVDASAVVSVEDMTVGDSMTTVTVRLDYPSGYARRPLYFITYHVDLVRGEIGWEVTAVRLGAIS